MNQVHQISMISLDMLVPKDHVYRKLLDLIDFKKILYLLKTNDKDLGYGIEKSFKMILLQYMEDLSDREMERFMQENVASKYLCGFGLLDKTPDHSTFGVIRNRVGTSRLSKIFTKIREQLKQKGYISECFTFVDATHLISKANLWEERDKAIKLKYDKLNNESLPKVAHDKEARIGCKGKTKYWYGYKKHVSVDMKHGLVNKISVTPANQSDASGLEHICPTQGAVIGDKGYCTKQARTVIIRRGCHDATIKKNNIKIKNKEKDKFLTKLRAPFENVFSQFKKKVRYSGVLKNQFAAFMESIVFNFKRLISIAASPIFD
jgi:IS5 family transposase